MIEKSKFEPYDSPNRWLINSRTDSHASYLVDLGRPECQCRFWVCEVAPKLKRGLNPKKCTHYYIARERFADWAMWQFAQHDPNKHHDQEQLT